MKRALTVGLMLLVAIFVRIGVGAETAQAQVVRVATALDHLTVLEFADPVTMAAAGSSSYQIEWKGNKVFIKPLKAGATTDLFVWTAARRFNYELHTDQVQNMNFAIDNAKPVPSATPTPQPQAALDQIADMVLTRAFLGSERLDTSYIKDKKGRVIVRLDHVFRSNTTLYIHYSVLNLSGQPYRLLAPELRQLTPLSAKLSLVSMRNSQLDDDLVKDLGAVKEMSVGIAHAETAKTDLAPNEETEGVVAIRGKFSDLTIFDMQFLPQGGHSVRAVFVH